MTDKVKPGEKCLDEDGDLEVAVGTFKTEVDCVNCAETFLVEGDADGDEVRCDACGAIMLCRRV